MHGADPCASQHGDGQLRDHAQIDGHTIAAAHTDALQTVGEATDLHEQLAVRDPPLVAGLALPEIGYPVGVGIEVTVEAVVGDVQSATHEPLHPGRIPIQHLRPAARPIESLRLLGPETLQIGFGLLIYVVRPNDRAGAEGVGGIDDTKLFHQGVDVGQIRLAHSSDLQGSVIAA